METERSSASTQPRVTYLLVGGEHGIGDSRKHIPKIREMEKDRIARGELVIIAADTRHTLQESLKHIKPPAEVILLAHGTGEKEFYNDNPYPTTTPTFIWRAGNEFSKNIGNGRIVGREFITYEELFKAIPQGVDVITNGACHGQRALDERALSEAPTGVLIHSLANETVKAMDVDTLTVLHERSPSMNPTRAIVSNLDNINSGRQLAAIKQSLEEFGLKISRNYGRLIGIGGAVNHIIDLARERTQLRESTSVNLEALHLAESLVLAEFNTTSLNGKRQVIDSGPEAAAALKQRITTVKDRLMRGEPLHGEKDSDFDKVMNDRIADALTIAYLDSSGELARRQNFVRHYSQLAKEPTVSAEYATGVEKFATKFGIAVTSDAKLSAEEEKTIRAALGIAEGASNEQVLKAMLNTEISGTLPNQQTTITERGTTR